MSRYAIVNKDNVVVNVIVWEGSQWSPPADCIMVKCPNGATNIGDKYYPQSNTFIKPLNP